MKPRWLARFVALLTFDSWRMCPVCKQMCAGTEQHESARSVVPYVGLIFDTRYHMRACQKSACVDMAQSATYSMSREEFDDIMRTGGSHYL